MTKQYFFISGLPRSGSTLLSAILLQNPKFYSDIASPVSTIFSACIDYFTFSESNQNVKENQRKNSLLGLIDGFYKEVPQNVIFDSSREWTSKTSLLRELFPNTKILCCVRDVSWILDSFERITAKNPFYTNTLIQEPDRFTVETRMNSFMDPNKNGVVVNSLRWLEEGLALNSDMIHLIEYEQLCKYPKKTMEKIYELLDIDYFEHDFNSLEYKNELFDSTCNLRDLHTVRKKVEWIEKKTILPRRVWEKYSNFNFWRDKHIVYS